MSLSLLINLMSLLNKTINYLPKKKKKKSQASNFRTVAYIYKALPVNKDILPYWNRVQGPSSTTTDLIDLHR